MFPRRLKKHMRVMRVFFEGHYSVMTLGDYMMLKVV